MKDDDIAAMLRSDASLVLVEAPAGCGKTHQGASFAADLVVRLKQGRLLILTHTHAARSVFASRAKSGAASIRTIDSFLTEIATAYHAVLNLPPDVGRWAIDNNKYDEVASLCRHLLERSSVVAEALADRYPWIVCDEHQDASEDRHRSIMAIHRAGSRLRIFGDPMQMIFARSDMEIKRNLERWEALKNDGEWGRLEYPHRWGAHSPALGKWILESREALQQGGRINLKGRLPDGLAVHIAENSAQAPRNSMMMTSEHRAPINALVRKNQSLLVLATENNRVEHLNAFFGRTMPIWEGHKRDNLAKLIEVVRTAEGDASTVSNATLDFLYATTSGFSASSHGNRLAAQVADRCSKPARGGSINLQVLAKHLIDEPDHRGVGKALGRFTDLVRGRKAGFEKVELNLRSEIRDAIQLGDFDDVDQGFAEISRRRSFTHPNPASRSLSTVHKSKGLECDHALILPCDKTSYSDSGYKRRLFYVGISRARKSLTLAVSRKESVPFLEI